MPLLSYDPMEDGNAASANLWNVRLSKIHDLFNGNLDAANLANGAVTTPKIADGAVTSAKLGFTKYTDANGWLVTDLGLVKLATKARSFTIPSTANGGIGFVTVADNSAPVGFNPAGSYNAMIACNITNGNAYRWSLVFEQASKFAPTTLPVFKNVGGGTFDATGTLETWVIF